MKRSEINAALRWAEERLREANISLPPFARWDCATWRENQARTQVIREVMLGWDITDLAWATSRAWAPCSIRCATA